VAEDAFSGIVEGGGMKTKSIPSGFAEELADYILGSLRHPGRAIPEGWKRVAGG